MNSKTTLGAQYGLDVLQTLLNVAEAVVDELGDTLVDEGKEGVCQGAGQVGRIGDEEGLADAVWVRHDGRARAAEDYCAVLLVARPGHTNPAGPGDPVLTQQNNPQTKEVAID